MPTRSFVCLTNIPTPYRLFQFQIMHRELAKRDWKFEVWFMAASEQRREWTFTEAQFDFPQRLLRGVRLGIGSDPIYFNPELWRLLQKTQPEVLLIGGAWIHPTVWMACMSSAPRRTVFWSESHLESMKKPGSVLGYARRLVLSQFREFAVPGILAKRYVEHYAIPTRIHFLPNIVDPTVFCSQVHDQRRKVKSRNGNSRRLRALLITARLAPEKGLIQFLNSLRFLSEAEKKNLAVWIAGSGPQCEELQRWINDNDLEVQLLGHQTETRMVELYAEADGFCLPSILDPNPLSVIEALWAGLPLLLSSRVGNHNESLREGGNGFLFNPGDRKSITDAVSRWLALSTSEVALLGHRSLGIAQSRFEPHTVIRSFLDQVIEDSWHTADSDAEPVEMIAPL